MKQITTMLAPDKGAVWSIITKNQELPDSVTLLLLEVLLLILCRAASSAALSHTEGFRMGGGVHDSYTFQCGLVGSFTSPGIDTRWKGPTAFSVSSERHWQRLPGNISVPPGGGGLGDQKQKVREMS